MENTYYKEWTNAQNLLDAERVKNSELEKDISSMEIEIQMLRLEVQEKVNEIVELTMTDDDCPCGGDCGCKGDDYDGNEDLLP